MALLIILYKTSANAIECSILCERANGVFRIWVLWECLCTVIVNSLFYSETFSVATCDRMYIAKSRKFSVSIFLLSSLILHKWVSFHNTTYYIKHLYYNEPNVRCILSTWVIICLTKSLEPSSNKASGSGKIGVSYWKWCCFFFFIDWESSTLHMAFGLEVATCANLCERKSGFVGYQTVTDVNKSPLLRWAGSSDEISRF